MTRPAHLILFLSCIVTAAAQSPDKVNRDAQVVQDFTRRVGDYVKLHRAAQSETHRLKPTDSPAAIKSYEHQLAGRIRESRSGAAPGSIFTPAVSEEFRRLIGIAMQGPEGVRIRESMQHAAPAVSRAPMVNSPYPDTIPLQSTPPSLLLNLPPLPPEVDYRVVGHDLILRDVDANIVVDFIRNVV